MLDLEIFGAKLREHRKKLGLTQEAVADRVGVSAQAVSKWESGECLPDCFNLKSLGESMASRSIFCLTPIRAGI